MIRAILFDFNGVLVDDEPLHLQLFQKVMAEENLELTKENYFNKYLGMDDFDCFRQAGIDLGKKFDELKIQELIDRKANYYQKEIMAAPPFVPGAMNMVRALGATHYLAVVSGALRSEIELLLKLGGANESVSTIVAAGEISQGKPHPGGYQKAMELLNRDFVASSERLLPEECLAIEDSRWGIDAALAAGMSCVGITTTYSEKELPGVLFCLKDFQDISTEEFLEKVEVNR